MIQTLFDTLAAPSTWTVLLVQCIGYVVVFFCLKWILTYTPIKPVRQKEVLLVFAAVFVTLFLLEAGCHIFGVKKTYAEKRNGKRQTDVNYVPGSFSPWPPDSVHYLHNEEFSFTRQTNSLGLSDREWQVKKDKLRIIALGDSFTEGDGAPSDSSWVALVQERSDKDSLPVEWMNAGLCGSDPFYEYQLLKDQLLDYDPDLIIVATQDQDYVEDILLKGGAERWEQADQRTISLFELLYSYSRLSRLFIENILGYNELLVRTDKRSIKKLKEKHIPAIIDLYAGLAVEHRVPVIFVYFPSRYGIYEGHHQFYFEEVYEQGVLNKEGIAFYDLLSCYQAHIAASKRQATDFWWPRDGHHNSDGYMMMADCIYQYVRPELVKRIKDEDR